MGGIAAWSLWLMGKDRRFLLLIHLKDIIDKACHRRMLWTSRLKRQALSMLQTPCMHQGYIARIIIVVK
jgi:hypothetical protein